jgi:sugar lactone lactonase YvrE
LTAAAFAACKNLWIPTLERDKDGAAGPGPLPQYDWVVTTVAGDGTAGYLDGIGTAARFDNPGAITMDTAGNLYVTDNANHRIRKIANDGPRTVSTIAGDGASGYNDGPGAAARCRISCGITADAGGNLYVTDNANHRIRKIANDGPRTVTTIAGDGTPGWLDGAGTAARFNDPYGITVDAAGNLYVTDRGTDRIRKIDAGGGVTTIAGDGTAGYLDGAGTAARFDRPQGITMDAAGNLYVADAGNDRIRRLSWRQVN